MQAGYRKYTFQFKFEAGTSRGVLHSRDSWFIVLKGSRDENQSYGLGECAPLPGLSIDNVDAIEKELRILCNQINAGQHPTFSPLFPSIRFGFEMAQRDLSHGGKHLLFPSKFTEGLTGIPINGLVWMGDFNFMKKQLKEKIEAGFSCIKLKIGAIDFDKELELIRMVRKEFGPDDLEIRVDANGAFKPEEALDKLKHLSAFQLHSIEQPIRQRQWEQMAALCERSPIPIALDEELIGVADPADKQKLLSIIKPQFIILKPSLVGGFAASEEWIQLAEKQGTGWWVTSALESNIGLNAIAQWTYNLKNPMPQGLGTGQLYTNNIESPLIIENGELHYRPETKWKLKDLLKK
ncbi:MAG: o-succinylbenzoate synthase [Bacteroidetes bacterium]|nr:o-succinylbenzoate synthase [Bacteroidota bacterium]